MPGKDLKLRGCFTVPKDKKVETMYQRVKEYVRHHHMLDKGDRIITGVSGGADSICLLFMLMRLKEELNLTLLAVHVHHGLRDADADADEQYVRRICEEWQVELRVFHEDVREAARQNGLSLEEAGRNVRREIFLKVLGETNGTRIALAHHQNDNAETLIWNLCRGCGIKGLGGIAPVTGRWIRPLLCLKRDEIESYLENRGISYCTDASNLEDDYTRNRIRKHVVPYLEEHVNRQAVLHMAETMEQMRMLEEYIMQETERYAGRCIRCGADGRTVLDKEGFGQVPGALRLSVIHEMLCRTAGRRKDLEARHARMLLDLLDRQVGRQIHLPYGIRARRCYEGIELAAAGGAPEAAESGRLSENSFSEAGTDTLRDQTVSGAVPGCPAVCRVFERTGDEVIFPEKTYTKWFDYDIIRNTVKIRHREPGDYITISREGGTQKLKQYFINEKIPGSLRDRIWLAADGKHIMWIVGYRQNQKYQITEKTRRILEIEFYGGQDNGGKYKGVDPGAGCGEED